MAKKDDDNHAGDIKLPVHSVGKIIFLGNHGFIILAILYGINQQYCHSRFRTENIELPAENKLTKAR